MRPVILRREDNRFTFLSEVGIMKEQRKRVDIVKIKMCKEGSIMYGARKISSPSDAVNLIGEFMGDSDREEFIIIAIDTKNQPTAINVCSIGTLNATLVHPREVFKMAILANANSIIIAHNHPSGDVSPSKEDINITTKLKEAGDIIGINITDHLIIGSGNYMSFKEQKMI